MKTGIKLVINFSSKILQGIDIVSLACAHTKDSCPTVISQSKITLVGSSFGDHPPRPLLCSIKCYSPSINSQCANFMPFNVAP